MPLMVPVSESMDNPAGRDGLTRYTLTGPPVETTVFGVMAEFFR